MGRIPLLLARDKIGIFRPLSAQKSSASGANGAIPAEIVQ
jgi:hypothetical protein